jgi:hypothetical protein
MLVRKRWRWRWRWRWRRWRRWKKMTGVRVWFFEVACF